MKTIAGSILILSSAVVLSGMLQSGGGNDEIFVMFVCPPAIFGVIILIWGLCTESKAKPQ